MTSQNDIDALRSRISSIRQTTNEQWMSTLDDRKLKELQFHDEHRDRSKAAEWSDEDRKKPAAMDQDTYERFYGNKKYYTATDASRQYTANWIATNAKNKIFLDYACGNGVNAIAAAKAGARLSMGLDISPISVANAANDAKAAGVGHNTEFFQADCENTKLADHSVDTIICSGMLHHLDLNQAYPELARILKPGGRILAVEALDYNPAIKLYRMRTPEMRTEWEKSHILSLKDVRHAQKYFDLGDVKYWHILGIAAPHVGPLAPVLHAFDSVLTKIPFVQRMAWIFTFELIGRGSPRTN